MSAPAHTRSPLGDPLAAVARLLAALDRALPFLGPAVALVLGLAALGRRSLDVDEAAAAASARGAFGDVVERALSDEPARAGYLALLQPVVSWDDAEHWLRLPSVAAAVVAAVAAYRLGRRLAGRRAGAVASVVLASSLGVVSSSRSVGPLALALAAMLVSSALFARAVDRGGVVWWAVYAASAAFLPLTHPVAAAALAAQVLAVVAGRRELDLRLALPAVGVATLESAIFLTAAVVDRADAADGAGALELADVGVGVGRALGWSPVVAGLALWGLVSLRRRAAHGGRGWPLALVGGLAAFPLLAVLAAGLVLPVYPRSALVVAIGGLALAAGVGLLAIDERTLRLATLGAVGAVALTALVTAALREQREDWRAAATAVRAFDGPPDTVVVLPARARAALAYYAPDLRTSLVGRGEGVTVVVAGAPERAAAIARRVVSPPRYALLEERRVGTGLVVQRWVRP